MDLKWNALWDFHSEDEVKLNETAWNKDIQATIISKLR